MGGKSALFVDNVEFGWLRACRRPDKRLAVDSDVRLLYAVLLDSGVLFEYQSECQEAGGNK